MTYKPRLLASSALATIVLALPAAAQIAPRSLDSVVVTASPLSEDTTTIVDVVGRGEILHQGGANLADALKYVPGVSGTGFAAGASRPVIRGMDANRVRLLENGVSSSDVSDVGPDHGIPLDPLAMRQIEVVRGAATLRYGSQAIGGVINAINNRVPLTLPEELLTGELHGSYGSASDVGQGGALVDLRAGQFAFHADGFVRRAEDYDTPLGPQANSFSRQGGVSIGSSYFFGESRVGVAGVQFDSEYGIPSGDSYIVMHQKKILTDNSFQIGAGPLEKITFQGGYSDYEHSEIEPDGEIGATFLSKEFDGRAEAIFGGIGPLGSSAVGIQFNDKRFSALGEAQDYLLPTLTSTVAGYVFTDAPIGNSFHLQASGRVEQVHISGTPVSNTFTSRDFTPLSASVGMLWDATENLKFGFTFASAARAPAQTELFARGPHDGPLTFETGDPGLKMERSNSVEGTVRGSFGRFSFQGSVYNADFSNYIYGALTGRTCDDEGNCVDGDSEELRELNYAQRGANFWGAEAKASLVLWEAETGTFGANMLGDYVRARFDAGGGNVPRIQPYRVGGGLSWTSKSFDISFLILGVGTQDDFGAFDTPTDGYTEINAEAAWRPFASKPGFEISLVGHNLSDEVERNAVAFNKDSIVLPGRDIRVVLRQSF